MNVSVFVAICRNDEVQTPTDIKLVRKGLCTSLPFYSGPGNQNFFFAQQMLIQNREPAAEGSGVEGSNATSRAPVTKPAKDGTPKIDLEDSMSVPYIGHATLRLKEHWKDVSGNLFAIWANIKAIMTFDAKHSRRICTRSSVNHSIMILCRAPSYLVTMTKLEQICGIGGNQRTVK
jgi:hypothetical protein